MFRSINLVVARGSATVTDAAGNPVATVPHANGCCGGAAGPAGVVTKGAPPSNGCSITLGLSPALVTIKTRCTDGTTHTGTLPCRWPGIPVFHVVASMQYVYGMLGLI